MKIVEASLQCRRHTEEQQKTNKTPTIIENTNRRLTEKRKKTNQQKTDRKSTEGLQKSNRKTDIRTYRKTDIKTY